MNKEDYIQKKLDDNFRLWLERASLWGCFLFVSLGMLDYLVTPENFPLFLRYRATVSLLLLGGYFLSKRAPSRYLMPIGFVMVTGGAIAIELMILDFGGHESPYYVGMILLGISVVGFIPARVLFHMLITISAYAIYVTPILLTEHVAGHRDFLISNTFIVLIFSTMLLMRYLSGKALVAELGLQYDLEQYRGHLEAVVEERTRDLREAIHKLQGEIAERKKGEEERKRLQAQLLHVQKMESIGRLAGGVAHDFNNILTAILSYTELSLMRVPEKDPVREYLESIRGASEKAAGLTHQLLAFSRKQVLEMKVVDLNEIVTGMSDMLRRMIGEDVALDIRTGARPGGIRADRGQLEQVLMNLAVNARDAMPNGGRLSIETGDGMPDDAAGSGVFVVLSVTDTGGGMSEEVRDRIFEPFFTTKEQGKGTGLGLATVYGIVKQHGGHIVVDSRPGSGTTFRLFLPAAAATETEMEREPGGPPPRGNETILVVEDDGAVRELITEVLQPLGYRVLGCHTGWDAVSKAREMEPNAIILDIMMPGINGYDVLRLLKSEPATARIPVIVLSVLDEKEKAFALGAAEFVSKPFHKQRLLDNVRALV